MTQPLPWEKNTAVPVPPAPEPVPLDAYTAPAAPEPELVPLDIYDAPAPAPAPAKPLVDIDSLNPAQREAVLTTEGPLLVLAGAGSGKTRVLTFRIAHMLGDLGVKPWQVLAITFTNKAAAEMRERLAALIPSGTRGMWVCTFHAMCVRMLREDADLLGYTGQFTIYDDDDSKRMVRDIMQALGIEQKQFPINMIRSKISSAKNAMIGPEDMLKSVDSPNDKKAAQVYLELERRLRERGTETEEKICGRMAVARRELGRAFRYDYVVLNDEVSEAVKRIHTIIDAEKMRYCRTENMIQEVLDEC